MACGGIKRKPTSWTRDGGVLVFRVLRSGLGWPRRDGRTAPSAACSRGATARRRPHHGRVPRRPHARPGRPHRRRSVPGPGPAGFALALVSQCVHMGPVHPGRGSGDPRRPPSPRGRGAHPARPSRLPLRHAGPGGIPDHQQRGDHGAVPAPPLRPRWPCRRRRAARPTAASSTPAACERFNYWLRTIRPARRPTLWVKHLPLPHRPWIYLPSGLRTQAVGHIKAPLRGLNRLGGPPDEFVRRHNYQRHLLQLRFADRLVGRLVDRLVRRPDAGPHPAGGHERPRLLVHRRPGGAPPAGRRQRAPDRAGAADDQAARATGGAARRRLRRQRRRDPHDRRRARSTARLCRRRRVGVRRVRTGPPNVRPRRARGPLDGRLRGPASGLERAAARAVRLRPPRLLGRDRPQPPPGGPAGGSRSAAPRAGGLRAEILQPERLRRVRRASGSLPVEVLGHLHGASARRDLALAVNGRIQAVGTSFLLPGSRIRHFALLVPPSSLREGRNRVELFVVRRGDRLRLVGRV